MPPAPKHRAELERLLARGEWVEAKELAAAVLARNPRDGEAWLATGRCAIALGRLRVAEDALAKAAADRALAGDHRVPFFRAVAEHYLGRSSAAIDRLRALIAAGAPNSVDAHCFLVDILHRTGRREEMRALVAAGGPWLADLRGRVLAARARAADDRAVAAAELESIARGAGDPGARRNAGFEAVTLLDALGEYRRAWDLAGFLHQSTTAPFDDYAFREDIALQRQLVGRGKPWFEVRVPPVEGIALVAGMPRSGTTLLEQMLDRHPRIAGIGEYEGAFAIHESLVGLGVWPNDLRSLQPADAARLAAEYLEGAVARRRAGADWTFDKTLNVWRLLPAVAAVLPGSAFIHITRDARDTAISMHLSNFHPRSWGFTASLDTIRRVIALERALVPQMAALLGLRLVHVRYEDLVAEPEREIRRVLDAMGVPFDPAVLAPEQNARTVLTLSYEQVRRPINRSSIGRWRNYAPAFDASWDALA